MLHALELSTDPKFIYRIWSCQLRIKFLAMEDQVEGVKVLQVCTVAPSKGATTNSSTPITSLPLTFFDLLWLRSPPVERLFFYQLPNPTISFFDTILPNLKHSLSLTLQHFLPLAGSITWPQDSPHPIINYVPGNAVSFTVAESTTDNFTTLCSNTCEASQRHPLIPHLATSHEQASLMALQVTLFPGSGFSIGIATHHAAMDGKASTLFLKAWAYVCSNNLTESSLLSLPKHLTPFYDRSMIKDATGMGSMYVQTWLNIGGPNNRSMKVWDLGGGNATLNESVRGSFELTSSHIQQLKRHAKPKLKENAHVSTFSVTCAYVLQCLVKAEQPKTEGVAFSFSVDCRSRLEPPVPSTYFGNCIVGHKIMDGQRSFWEMMVSWMLLKGWMKLWRSWRTECWVRQWLCLQWWELGGIIEYIQLQGHQDLRCIVLILDGEDLRRWIWHL